ncbi:DNA-binding transcriptional regulator [Bartonella sp. ML70XJBT]|uniref:helix-turn-helix domain-containing protein n=1 Tax=Bartonella sp. ML70XJBT TaxID=3019096 RepID=UPI002361DCF1|nr:helix-turn-helix domain-containing protein [Bartonella sp. ML70XJBT]
MGKIAVKQLRKNLNLTLKEMAERLGVNKSTVWRWENMVFLQGEPLHIFSKRYGINNHLQRLLLSTVSV